MGRVKATMAVFLIIASLHALAQEKQPTETFLRNHVTVDGMKYFMLLGVNYKYSFWHNEKGNWQIGAQTGIASGFNQIGQPQGWSIPLGLFTEYGRKHRLGFDANVLYQWQRQYLVIQGYGDENVPWKYNWAFSSSAYYSYNFGRLLRYSVGIGGSIITYSKMNNSINDNYRYPTSFRPWVSVGIRF